MTDWLFLTNRVNNTSLSVEFLATIVLLNMSNLGSRSYLMAKAVVT